MFIIYGTSIFSAMKACSRRSQDDGRTGCRRGSHKCYKQPKCERRNGQGEQYPAVEPAEDRELRSSDAGVRMAEAAGTSRQRRDNADRRALRCLWPL